MTLTLKTQHVSLLLYLMLWPLRVLSTLHAMLVPPGKRGALELIVRHKALLILIWVGLLICSGCGAGGKRTTGPVEVRPRIEEVAGDVSMPTEVEGPRESGIETAGGALSGPVTTVRYGLDEQMASLLKTYGAQTAGVLAKIVASGILAVMGLLLWALNTPPPMNGLLRLVGQVGGLAFMLLGPLVIWMAF